MGIISSASGSSCWIGLDYYKNKKIKNILADKEHKKRWNLWKKH